MASTSGTAKVESQLENREKDGKNQGTNKLKRKSDKSSPYVETDFKYK